MKIVLNRKHGIFGLSNEVCEVLKCEKHFYDDHDKRTAPELIRVIEVVGPERASAKWANLEIVEIPDGFTDYVIEDYDGKEFVYYVMDGKIKKI